jgi:hypothetical protein
MLGTEASQKSVSVGSRRLNCAPARPEFPRFSVHVHSSKGRAFCYSSYTQHPSTELEAMHHVSLNVASCTPYVPHEKATSGKARLLCVRDTARKVYVPSNPPKPAGERMFDRRCHHLGIARASCIETE